MDNESREMFQKILDRLDKIDSRFDVIEHKQNRAEKKVDDLRIGVAVAERDIRRDIYELKGEMETVIEVLSCNDFKIRYAMSGRYPTAL